MHSSTNGQGLVTISGTDISDTFQHGLQDPETGLYPYSIASFIVEDLPSGTYTGHVSALLGSSAGSPTEMQLLGSCTLVVDAVNQTSTCQWFDGTLPLGGGGGPGDP